MEVSTKEQGDLEDFSGFLEKHGEYDLASEYDNSLIGIRDHEEGPVEVYDKLNPGQPIRTYGDVDELLKQESKENFEDNVVFLDLDGVYQLYDRRNQETRFEVDESLVVDAGEMR